LVILDIRVLYIYSLLSSIDNQSRSVSTYYSSIVEAVIGEYFIGIYRIFIYIEVMNPIVLIFLNALIATEGAKDTYFIKDKVVITIFIFIINKYNYKTEIVSL